MEEVKKNQPASKNFYLCVYMSILNSNCLPMPKSLGITKQSMNYYVKRLKSDGIIKKIGYGVWELIREVDIAKYRFEFKQVKKEVKKTTRGTTGQPFVSKINLVSKRNHIRGHAFQFTLKLPFIKNWSKRRDYLNKNNINYGELHLFGGGEKLSYLKRNIWITNKSIIIFDSSSYINDSANKARNYAISTMLEYVKRLESLFKTSFKINRGYKFKINRQHFARLDCEMAKQYRIDGKKLQVKQSDGTTWLWCDYSLNLDETETGNTKLSHRDMDNVISPFLNGLRELPGYTPQFVTKSLEALVKDRAYYAENLKSHVVAINKLGVGVEQLAQLIKKISK